MTSASRRLNILVVNQYYPPDTSATAEVFADLANRLAGAGHNVTVLSGRPSYDPGIRRPWWPRRREKVESVSVERVGSAALDRRRVRGRVVNYLSFVSFATIFGFLRPRPDVVLVGSDPPFAVWAALIAARGRRVVYSLRDLHPETAIEAGMIPPGLITRLWERIHTSGLRRCATVVTLGESMAERVVAKGIDRRRIEVIPDGAWSNPGGREQHVVVELRAGAHFVVMHAGNIGGAGAWEAIAGAAERLKGKAKFVFVGTGSHESSLGEGIQLVPFRPSSEVPSVMAAGDMQIVTLRRRMEGLVVPSKLYTVLAHGRPVLAVAPERSEVATIVRRYNCGLVADPDDPDDIAQKVTWALEHPAELEKMGRASLAASSAFDREEHLDRFVELVERIATHRTGEASARGHDRRKSA